MYDLWINLLDGIMFFMINCHLINIIPFVDVFYHHRASVWGIKIQDNYLITGSMDKTISLINLNTLVVEKHFIAHEDEWGGKFILP